tara:strand:+ start:288 stop:1508 length:1221 start_codon:yes stop_codon:yes gene_type:complete
LENGDSGSVRRAGIPQGITVVVAAFLPIIAIVAMFPAVPALIAHFHDDPTASWKVPAMVSAPGLTIAIVALFAGILVDRFGRRRLLLVSTFFYGIFGALPFFLTSLDGLYASRLLLGLSEAAILTTLNTLIGDYWDQDGRRNWLTLQGIAGPLLSSIVIFFAGSLVAWKWNAIFLIYLVGFPVCLAMWRWLYEPVQDNAARAMLGIDEKGSLSAFPWREVIGIGLLTLFSSTLYYVFIINGGIVWEELGITDPADIGRITALPSLFVVVGAAIFWALGKAGIGSRGQLFAFLATLGAGLAIIGLAPDWRWMIAGMAVQQTGAGMAIPTLIAWAQKNLPFEHRGRGMGVWTACFFFGQFSSPLIVGGVRSVAGSMQGAFLTAGIAGVVISIAIFLLMPRQVAEAVEN